MTPDDAPPRSSRFLAWPCGAHAASIAVDVSNDELGGDGDCSLCEAISAANTDSADRGNLTVIDGNATDRVMHVLARTGGKAGSISCPTAGAECRTSGGSGGNGGGVSGNGALTIEQSLLAQNRSGPGGSTGPILSCGAGGECFSSTGNAGDGGGVIISNSSLNLLATTVTDNESADWAGGVYCHHFSTCVIRNSTIAAAWANRTRDRVDELIEYLALPDHRIEFDIRGLPRPKSSLLRTCQVDYDDRIGTVRTKVVDSANESRVVARGLDA